MNRHTILSITAILLDEEEEENCAAKTKRKCWIDPYLSDRLNSGFYYTSYESLRSDGKRFFKYFRMSINSFDELLSLLEDDIKGNINSVRPCIPPCERLALVLRYFASGNSMQDLEFAYHISISAISNIVRIVCKAIWKNLLNKCMPPVSSKWESVVAGFQKSCNFPNCLGAIDGKHVRIVKPKSSGSSYYNYKKFFSIVLLAVCDSNYTFLYIDVGAYGKSSDSIIFQESTFHKKLKSNNLSIPPNKILPNSTSPALPHVLLGDEAFKLDFNILRPYGGNSLTLKKRVFNYRLSRARRCIECAFGLLANKWRIFHRPLDVSIDLAEDIIKVTCLLHNFVRERDGYKFKDTLTIPRSLADMENVDPGRTGTSVRDYFADYFQTEAGSVPWQNAMV